MKKYNHLYALAFSVNTDRHPEVDVDPVEIMEALALRICDVTTGKYWDEAIGPPIETVLNQPDYDVSIVPRRELLDSGELADQQRQLAKFSPPEVNWGD